MTEPISSSPSCRILVLSAEPSTSRNLIEQIVTRSKSTLHEKTSADNTDDDDHADNEGCIIDWRISNKYYDADVHFYVQPLALPPAKPIWPPENDEDKVPAVIYVFLDGEEYKPRFLSMKEGLEAHDAEVTMAVRLPSPFGDEDSEGDEDKDSDADSDAISDWFSNHGFEFVDVDPPVKLVVVSNEEEDELDPYDITGIPRIIGALSTIIWPSMIRKERKPFVPTRRSLSSQLATPVAVTRDSSVFPDDLDPQQEESHADHMSSTRSLFASPEGAVTMGDLDILESWLEGDELDPWKGRGVAVSASTPAAAPRSDDVVKDSSTTPHASEHSAGIGFEDDFTDFISAPQPVPKVDIVKGEGVTHAWERHPQGGEDEDDDVSLPSQEEIKITAQRIFGRRAFANQSSTSGSSNPHDPASVKGEDEEPFRFDLTEVLGALQSMKEEVGEIKDPAERRKAAARIALGFMEGLGVDDMKEEDLFDK